MSHQAGQPHDKEDALEMARKREIDRQAFNELHPDLAGITEDDTIEEWISLKQEDIKNDYV